MANPQEDDPFAGYLESSAPAPTPATTDPFAGYYAAPPAIEQQQKPDFVQRAITSTGKAISGAVESAIGQNEFNLPEITSALAADLPSLKPPAGENSLEYLSRLNRVRGDLGMVDVLREADPNMPPPQKDKFGNIVVRFQGKPYYINRGGISKRDIMEATRDTLIAAPLAGAAGAMTANAWLPVRMLGQAGAGFLSSIMTDLFSWGAGSKQGPDLTAAIGATVGAAGAEMAGSAVGAAIQRIRTNPAKFLERDGTLTDEGRRIFREAGMDPDEVSQNIAAEFARKSGETGAVPATARETAAREFDIPLTRGQATGDYSTIAFEESARRGGRGAIATMVMRPKFDIQEEAIRAAQTRVGEEVAPNVAAASPQESAGRVLESVRTQERAHGQMVRSAYRQAEEAAPGARIPKANLEGLGQSVRSVLAQRGVRLRPGSNITPAANEMLNIVDETTAGIIPEQTVPSGNAASNLGVAVKAMEQVRKELFGSGGLYESAIKSSPTDRHAAKAIKDGFNEWLDGVYNDAAMSGATAESLQQFKNARAAASKHFQLFGEQTQRLGRDDAGQVIERMVANDVTNQEVANFLWGSNQVGDSGKAYRVAKRIARIVGKNSDAWNAVRLGMWQRMTTAAEGADQPGAQRVAQNIFKFINGSGRNLARVLFTDAERAKMLRMARVLKMTVPPKQAVNYSASGLELLRASGGLRFYSGGYFLRIFDYTRNITSIPKAMRGLRAVPIKRAAVPPIIPAAGAAIGAKVNQ